MAPTLLTAFESGAFPSGDASVRYAGRRDSINHWSRRGASLSDRPDENGRRAYARSFAACVAFRCAPARRQLVYTRVHLGRRAGARAVYLARYNAQHACVYALSRRAKNRETVTKRRLLLRLSVHALNVTVRGLRE